MSQNDDASAFFGLLVPFEDASPSFVHGFEAGMVYQRMLAGDTEIAGGTPFHSDNVQLFHRMAAVHGYDVAVAPTVYDEWTDVTFTKRPRPRFAVVEGGAQ